MEKRHGEHGQEHDLPSARSIAHRETSVRQEADVLTVEFTVMGMFKLSEAFSFQVTTVDQAETERYWNAIVGNGGEESACGWCKDKGLVVADLGGALRLTRRRGLMMVRWLRRLVAMIFALMVSAAAYAAAAPTAIRSIDISEDGDGYVANVAMFAPVPLNVAWAVLTDFDHMASWVPNVRESKVVADASNVLTVEQRGTARFGIASFPYVSVRQMTLDPQRTVRAKQIQGSMKRLESLMTLTPEADGTTLNYRLEMVPSALAGAVLSKDFLKHELSEQFTAIIEEMTRRNR